MKKNESSHNINWNSIIQNFFSSEECSTLKKGVENIFVGKFKFLPSSNKLTYKVNLSSENCTVRPRGTLLTWQKIYRVSRFHYRTQFLTVLLRGERMPCVRKTVYLENFWTHTKTVYLRGPCAMRPCPMRSYCIILLKSRGKQRIWVTKFGLLR